MNARNIVSVIVAAAVAAAGCGSGNSAVGTNSPRPPAATTKVEARSPSGYKMRRVEELPPVGDPLPPLDDGRVEIAGPAGWRPLPRNSSQYLTGFSKGQPSQLPRIVVLAEDAPAGSADTTEANAHELAATLDAEQRADEMKAVQEHCLPIVLGDRTFVRHVRLARMSGEPLVIQSLQTVAGGRLYSVELICAVDAADGREYVQSLKKHRDLGYAVAANMRFGAAAAPLVEAPAKSAPAESSPADSGPAEATEPTAAP